MKYLIRSVKYFIYFSLLCSAIVAALVLIGAVEGNIDAIFSEGYKSVGKIAAFFAIVAAVYPKVGFITRSMTTDKQWTEIREDVLQYMNEHKYLLESENEGIVTFRFKGTAGRLSKMFEDRLTLSKTEDGYQLEGLRKDAMRLSMGLENILSKDQAS